MEHKNVFFRIFKKIDMDSVKNSAGNPLNLADFDLLCLETERTNLGGSNAPTHVPVRFFNVFEKKI